MTTAQNVALKNMYNMICFLQPPTVLTINAPTTGDSSIGVRKETPNMPYFRQNTTN